MKGIVLAGGSGTRLRPLTLAVSKQLLPVYDKPMVYYPLSTLMLAGIRTILLITTLHDIDKYRKLFGDGSALGLELSYAVQEEPGGLPQAFIIGERFIDGEPSTLILGDNLLVGAGLGRQLESIASRSGGGTIFAVEMNDPRAYGVVEIDKMGNILSIEEKPAQPKGNLAIPGIYFYDEQVVDYARQLVPSARGELEIVDLHKKYLDAGTLSVTKLSRGTTWLDMGTADALVEASLYVSAMEHRQGLVIGSPEEVAWRKGWITGEDLIRRADEIGRSPYAQYLRDLPTRGPTREFDWD
jgi:glucose-1-phosphate thymidylyltransferase